MPHDNKLGVKFVEDDAAFNDVIYKTDNQLRAMGYKIPVSKKNEEAKSDAKKDKQT